MSGGIQTDIKESKTDEPPREQPELSKRWLTELRLAQMYERHGRLKDAEATYLRVLRDGPPDLREKVINELAELTQSQDTRWWWDVFILEPLNSVGKWILRGVWILLLTGLVYTPMALIGKRFGKNKLEVIPLIDTTPNKLGRAFEEIVAVTLEKMRYHFAKRGLVRGEAPLPVIVQSQTAELAGLITDLASSVRPEWLGKLIAWLAKRVTRPEYSVRGVMEEAGQQVNITLRLQQRGRTVEVWDRNVSRSWLLEAERDIAYEMLIFLKEHISYGHAA